MHTFDTYHAVLAHFDGSPTKLAQALSIDSTPRVCNWRDRGIPAQFARQIEGLTGISVQVLRPADWHKFWPERSSAIGVSTGCLPATTHAAPTQEASHAGV